MDQNALVKKEIMNLHQSFQDWYTGKLSRKQLDSVIGDHLDQDFYIVFPDATKQSKTELVDMMRTDYANDTSFCIEIKDIKIQELSATLYLANYQEWQYWGNDNTQPKLQLMSSALIQHHASGYTWIAIHETQNHL